MTLKDLVTAGLVGENEPITVARKLGLNNSYDVRIGSWHDDPILDYFNYEINSFTWSFAKGLMVVLR